MATIKSYTDIEQSRKLVEILPIESADMVYIKHATSDNLEFRFDDDMPPMVLKNVPISEITADTLPCWSLAALLKFLESEIDGEEGETYQLSIEKDGTWWNVWYKEQYDEANPIETESTEELIDACVAMIEKLYKLKML